MNRVCACVCACTCSCVPRVVVYVAHEYNTRIYARRLEQRILFETACVMRVCRFVMRTSYTRVRMTSAPRRCSEIPFAINTEVNPQPCKRYVPPPQLTLYRPPAQPCRACPGVVLYIIIITTTYNIASAARILFHGSFYFYLFSAPSLDVCGGGGGDDDSDDDDTRTPAHPHTHTHIYIYTTSCKPFWCTRKIKHSLRINRKLCIF